MPIEISTASFTRPSDTTPYDAKDVVSNSTSAPAVMTFSEMAPLQGGKSGYITKARLFTNQSTNTASFRLHLFHTAPTPINDNSPYTLLWANRTSRIGYIDFPACSTEGTGSDASNAQKGGGVSNANLAMPFTCASDSRAIYGVLETLTAFTPASGQLFFVELTADQD